jgi:uncharacterized protein (DUF1778 family)
MVAVSKASKFGQTLTVSHTKKDVRKHVKEILDDESYEEFMDALMNPSVSLGSIQRALTALGCSVHKASLHRWRHAVVKV